MQRKSVKVIVEKHSDGYVAYPLGLRGVVVAEGETFEDAMREVQSAIRFHVETFGAEMLEQSEEVEAFVGEAIIGS